MATPRKPKDQHKPSGRPSAFRPEHLKIIRAIALSGGGEVLMQEMLGISQTTWNRWKVDRPEVLEAISVSDDDMFRIARQSLAKRAAGFERRAVKIMTVSIGNGMSEVVEVPYIEYYPPDATAAWKIMTSREPGTWRERQEVEQRGDVVVRVEGGLPDKEPEK